MNTPDDMNKRSFKDLLLNPFGQFLPLFILLFLLSATAGVLFSLTVHDVKMALLHIAHGVILAYLLTFIIGLFPWKGVRTALAALVILPLAILLYTDIVCILEFHSDFSADFIAILLGTDPSESAEFIGLHLKGFIAGFLVLATFLAAYFIGKKRRMHLSSPWNWASLAVVAGCVLLLLVKPQAAERIIKEKSIEGKLAAFFSYAGSIPPDYAAYVFPADLETVRERQPENIVLIFGESQCRSHCQFNGYDKVTMPLVQALIDSGRVATFDKVTSPGINTVESFKSMMCTYQPEMGDAVKFYTCQTIPQTIRDAGYRSSWISNQSGTGLFNNIIANFAALCDTSVFIGDKFKGNMVANLDGDLLPVARDYVGKNAPGKNFYVFHLMGSHPDFADRYPAEFAHFKAEDYPDRPASQRPVFAEYDNSILYTDYIVSELIQLFRDKEAIIIYLADHALDFYFTRDDYFSHALASVPESVGPASEVPFFIYTSERYEEQFPDVCERIAASRQKDYRTDALIYTVMDIAGVQFKDKSEINGTSILE